MPKLVVFRGDEVEREVPLKGSTVRIGRDTRNELALEDPTQGVSRFHAEIRSEGGRYVVADLKSRNGVWIGGQRIRGKAELTLGVPVTIGPFEIVLEDDVSSGMFEDEPSSGGSATVVAAPAVRGPRTEAAGRASGPRPSRAERLPLAWIAAAALVLGVGVVAWVVVRNIMGPATTTPTNTVATTESPTTVPPPTTSVPIGPPPDDTATRIAESLAMAREQIQAGEYSAALPHLDAVLALDPGNAEAAELRRQAEDALRPPPPPVRPTPVETVEEADGIPRRPNEPAAVYRTRAGRIQAEWSAAQESLAKEDYAAAIRHFRAVEQDEPAYPGLGQALGDVTARQQAVFTEAMTNGQGHEARGNLRDARGWYERAVVTDPTSTTAREKALAVRTQLFDRTRKLLEQGNYAMKSGDREGAVIRFRQILDLLKPGDEIRDQAEKRLEELKQ